jgi:hypothetical protein
MPEPQGLKYLSDRLEASYRCRLLTMHMHSYKDPENSLAPLTWSDRVSTAVHPYRRFSGIQYHRQE